MIDFWILWIVIAIVVGLFLVRTLVDTAHGSEGTPLSWKARASKMSILALVVVVLGLGFGYLFRFPVGDSTPVQAIPIQLQPTDDPGLGNVGDDGNALPEEQKLPEKSVAADG
jgi:hypothetical protein